jgi:hypothetical protein
MDIAGAARCAETAAGATVPVASPSFELGQKPIARDSECRRQDAQKDPVFCDHVDCTRWYWLWTIMSQNETSEKMNFSMSP